MSDSTSQPDDAVDRWLADQRRAVADDLASTLDLEAGLREAMIPARHADLVADLRDVLDVEAGLSAIVPATPASSSEADSEKAWPAYGRDLEVGLVDESGRRAGLMDRQTTRGRPTGRGRAMFDGMYRQSVTRSDPGCIVILLDRSASMKAPWAGTGGSLAEGAALVLNNILLDLCIRATTEVNAPVRNYFDIGVFGYGARVSTPGEGVESAFGGPLAGRGLVPLPELANNPLTVRSKIPIWVEQVHGHRTPMCEAIAVAGSHVFDWAAAHPNSFPPIVINITDGMVTDSPYDGVTLPEWVSRLTAIETSDGPTLFFNVFLSPTQAPEIIFPAGPAGLPAPGPDLFAMSSLLPPPMAENARANGLDVQPRARGLAFNVGRSSLLKVLQIGTRVPVFAG